MLETYYRKRPRRAHQAINSTATDMDQCSQKVAAQSSTTAAKSPFLGRHHGPLPSERHSFLIREPEEDGNKSQMQNHIKVGNLYEFDHSHLPPRSPIELRSIRVVKVSEMIELSVAVSFPSMDSLRAFFSNRTRDQMQPVMDEKYVMGIGLAEKVLFRLVPMEIFNKKKGDEAFWLTHLSPSNSCKKNAHVAREKGICLSELINRKGMLRWGVKRQVKYIGRKTENQETDDVNPQNSSASSFVNAIGDGRTDIGGPVKAIASEEDGSEDGIDGENIMKHDEDIQGNAIEAEEENVNHGDIKYDNEEDKEENIQDDRKNSKGKRYASRSIDHVRKSKKEKLEKRRPKQKQKNQARSKETLVLRNPKDRWSAERYKLAEQSLLEVMKAEGATADKPILRPQLRIEARKRIGDTGLLDHLLKHMAGRLAPGGKERFRRRHNADGAMEYWLESADLINIRKDAGVNDPFWVPPPGWNPGDPPTQDRTCARELKLLKDEMSKIKRELGLMVTKMQLEEEVGKLRRELDEFTSRIKEGKQPTAITSSPHSISQTLDQLAASFDSSKFDLYEAPASAAVSEMYKEQLMNISDFVEEVEEKIGLLTSNMGERTSTDSALMVPAEKGHVAEEAKCKQQEVQALMASDAEKPEPDKDVKIPTPNAENKAAKIQRLKSGFRICRPQGTFLWPNMVKNCQTHSSPNMISSPKVVVQVEVPTPPSVSSSTASAPPQLPNFGCHHHPACPIKPLAERRAIAVTVSNCEAGANSWSPTYNSDPPTYHPYGS